MLLTKIRIKNYKGIKDITMDLKSNISQSKKDIMSGRFKETSDKKHIVPAFAAIFGRNGIGKTSVFEAIGFFTYLENGRANNLAIMKLQEELTKENFQMPETPKTNAEFFMEETLPDGMFHERFLEIQKIFFSDTFNFVANNKEKNVELELFFDIDGMETKVKWTLFTNGVTRVIDHKQHEDEIIKYVAHIGLATYVYVYKKELIIGSDRNDNDHIRGLATVVLPNLKQYLGIQKLDELISLADPKITKIVWVKQRDGRDIPESFMTDNGPLSLLSLSIGTIKFLWLVYRIYGPTVNKTPTLVLIDEIELSLHQELIDTLKMIMTEAFVSYGIQYIFTTHSPLAVSKGTSFKQIFSMEEGDEKHEMRKMSINLKPTQSVVKKYQEGFFSVYPDKQKSRNFVAGLFTGEDE